MVIIEFTERSCNKKTKHRSVAPNMRHTHNISFFNGVNLRMSFDN